MFRTGKYQRKMIVAEGVPISKQAVIRAEKKEEVKETKKDEEQLKAERQKLFRAWKGF